MELNLIIILKKFLKNYLSKYKKDNDIEDDSIFNFTKREEWF